MKFLRLALVFDEIEKKSSRLEMTHDVAEAFKQCNPKQARQVTLLMQGIIAPPHEGIELGMADKLAMRAIEIVSGKTEREVEAAYRKKGDLGDAAEELLSRRSQHALTKSELTVEKVYGNFHKIATAGGGGSQDHKVKLLAELLSNAEPNEAKVIIRFVTGNLRLGVGESTIIDALSEARCGDKTLSDEIERAYNLTSDLGAIAETLLEKGMQAISAAKPKPFNPIKPALAERLENAAAIIEKIGKNGCSVEGKFDGFRLAVHKKGARVEFYSRRQERVTQMFPDLAEGVRKQISAEELIAEGEAIGYNEATNTFLPFQETMQRKRKHDVAAKAEEIPLKLFLFELLYVNGDDYTQRPYRERRERLLKIVKNAGEKEEKEGKNGKESKMNRIDVAPAIVAKTPAQLQRFFDESVASGLEGIVAKDFDAPYTAGARKFAWIKMKKSYSEKLADTVDVVIIGYYYGKGKRTEFGLGGLLTAVYDDAHRRFRSVAKIGTGFSEAQLAEFASSLGKLAVKKKPENVDALLEPDVWVKPRIVVEINADEITRSPIHVAAAEKNAKEGEAEGLALRFPRLVRLRDDKTAEQATTERELIKLFEMQRESRGQSSA